MTKYEQVRQFLIGEKIKKLKAEQKVMEVRLFVEEAKRKQAEYELRYNHNHDPKNGRFTSGTGLTGGRERGIIDSRNMANGGRRSRSYILTDEDIKQVMAEAEAIGIPVDILEFNTGTQTGFADWKGKINIRGDIFPDETSRNNRDQLSVRAVLAHEYYGHYMSHPSPYKSGDWHDEFNASYKAAVKAPDLTAEDRARLMIDAYERPKAAGIVKEYDDVAKGLIYGNRF